MKNSDLAKVAVSDKDIIEAREKLGDAAKQMTDEQLRDQVAAMKYLADAWLDEYEKSIFDGKTLNEKLVE